MRAEALALVCVGLLGACRGADLIVGDGPAADSGTRDTLPADVEALRFEPPHAIPELESDDVSDDDPSLSSDMLLLCFNSKRDGGTGKEDIWCSQRASSDQPWGAPEPQSMLNTKHRETGIALSLDGLALWFSSDRDGDAAGLDVYLSTRDTRDSAWSEPARVPELSSEDDDLVSSIDETGLQLLLARRTRSSSDDDDDAGDYNIVLTERATPSDPWQAPQPLSELNTDASESDAFLVGQGFDLIFSRSADLMLARRAKLNAAFDHIEPMEVLNTDKNERDAWTNSAFTYIIFSSNRDGSYRLYESTRAQ